MKSFTQYDKEHPSIWEAFKNTTLEAIEKGFTNYSSKSIFEIIRWHSKGDVKKDGFKINNNYTGDYARKFMNNYPIHKNFFRTRRMRKAN